MISPRHLTRSSTSAALVVALLAPTCALSAAMAAPAPIQAPAPTEPPLAEPQPREVPLVATDRSEDELVLLDGSFIRGSVVELAKGSHVTISVLGEPRRIEWSKLAEVRLGQGPRAVGNDPEEAPGAASTPPATEPTEPTEPTNSESPLRKLPADADERRGHPYVHIESTNGEKVTLYGISGSFAGTGNGVAIAGSLYTPICTGSCDQLVDGSRGTSFFVGGETLTKSRPFTLDEDRGRLTLEVRAGRTRMKIMGFLLISLGAGSLCGVGLFASDDPGFRTAGIAMTSLGVSALGFGIPLAVLSRTVVKKRKQ